MLIKCTYEKFKEINEKKLGIGYRLDIIHGVWYINGEHLLIDEYFVNCILSEKCHITNFEEVKDKMIFLRELTKQEKVQRLNVLLHKDVIKEQCKQMLVCTDEIIDKWVEKGLDLRNYKDYSMAELNILMKFVELNYDINKFTTKMFYFNQLDAIYDAYVETGIDVLPYITKETSPARIRDIGYYERLKL